MSRTRSYHPSAAPAGRAAMRQGAAGTAFGVGIPLAAVALALSVGGCVDGSERERAGARAERSTCECDVSEDYCTACCACDVDCRPEDLGKPGCGGLSGDQSFVFAPPEGDGWCDCGWGSLDRDCEGTGCAEPGCLADGCEYCVDASGEELFDCRKIDESSAEACFPCDDGSGCIPWDWICECGLDEGCVYSDLYEDCADGSDEDCA